MTTYISIAAMQYMRWNIYILAPQCLYISVSYICYESKTGKEAPDKMTQRATEQRKVIRGRCRAGEVCYRPRKADKNEVDAV
jgi:hypothetical protein